jgi:hypothetical protein
MALVMAASVALRSALLLPSGVMDGPVLPFIFSVPLCLGC